MTTRPGNHTAVIAGCGNRPHPRVLARKRPGRSDPGRWTPRYVPGDGRKRIGARGENAAAAFLEASGLRVLVRNYRCRFGEIDLIATEGETLVFVEVKLRHAPLDPFEAVDARKQSRLSRAAFDFLERRGMLAHPARFDVIAVEGRTLHCEHIRDAFEAALD